MSVVCAAIKDGDIAIGCDTQISFGSISVTSKHLSNSNKLHKVNGSIIGIVGWNTLSDMVDHLIMNRADCFQLSSRMEIYSTLLNLHTIMKSDYFLKAKGGDDKEPVESSQLSALIVNQYGLFEITKYREVNQYQKFWTVGSGRQYALGAMQAVYSSDLTAAQIVTAGIDASCEFDRACSLPSYVENLQLKPHDSAADVIQA